MDSSRLRQNSSPAGLFYNLNHPNGPYELTTKWTMEMTFSLLPWKPLLVFTGASVMGINPENGKFCSHLDHWDSIKNNEHFSTKGLVDLIKQLQIYKTPDLETPKYQMLKRMATYEFTIHLLPSILSQEETIDG